MVYHKNDPAIKAMAVKMSHEGRTLLYINETLDVNISPESLNQWSVLFRNTNAVVWDPVTYLKEGPPAAIDEEGLGLLEDMVNKDPCLYVDEITSAFQSRTGIEVSESTVGWTLRRKLGLQLKMAQTVHPKQSELARGRYACLIGEMPPEELVFLDESAVCLKAVQQYCGQSRIGKQTS